MGHLPCMVIDRWWNQMSLAKESGKVEEWELTFWVEKLFSYSVLFLSVEERRERKREREFSSTNMKHLIGGKCGYPHE